MFIYGCVRIRATTIIRASAGSGRECGKSARPEKSIRSASSFERTSPSRLSIASTSSSIIGLIPIRAVYAADLNAEWERNYGRRRATYYRTGRHTIARHGILRRDFKSTRLQKRRAESGGAAAPLDQTARLLVSSLVNVPGKLPV